MKINKNYNEKTRLIWKQILNCTICKAEQMRFSSKQNAQKPFQMQTIA